MITLPEMDQDELAQSISMGEPDAVEHFKASVADGFNNTTVGVAWNKYQESKEDWEDERVVRNSQNQAYENLNAHFQKRKAKEVEPPQPPRKRLTQDEWKESPYFREGLKFEDGYSEDRAKFMAETYDENKFREHTLSQSKGVKRGAIGFAGQMVGSLIDPINLVPFGAAVGVGVKGVATVGRVLTMGAVEGAVGNLATSAITRPYWQDRGVDSTWKDYVADTMLGGVLGTGFSALGYGISKAFNKSAANVISKQDINIKDQKVIADTMDYVMESVAKGEQPDLSKIPELESTIKNIWEAPEIQRSQKVMDLHDTLVNDFKFSTDDAKISITPLVAHAQVFSKRLGMNFDDFINTYGISRIESEIKYPKKTNPNLETPWNFQGETPSKTPDYPNEAYAQEDAYFQGEAKSKHKGSVTFKEDGSRIVTLMGTADKSTLLHEMGHIFLDNMEKFSLLENADQALKDEMRLIKNWIGVKGDGPVQRRHHEKFARGFEQYLMEGKAPRSDLQNAFDTFKDWFKSIYKSSDDLNAKLSDDARGIYSRLMGDDSNVNLRPLTIEAPEPLFKSESDLDIEVDSFQTQLNDPTLKDNFTGSEIESLKNHLEDIKADESALPAISKALTLFQSDLLSKAKVKDFDFKKIPNEVIKESGLNKKDFERLAKETFKEVQEEALKHDGNINDFVVQKALENMKKKLAIEAKEKARQVYLGKLAREQVYNKAQHLMDNGATPEEAILAQLEGSSRLRGVEGAGNTVWGRYNSYAQSELAQIFTSLRQLDPATEKLFMNDIEFNERVVLEMLSMKGDEVDFKSVTNDNVAFQAAKILKDKAEKMRVRANNAGAKIGKLEMDGWIPRTHDVEKMILKGSDEWVKYMKQHLDLERSFKDLDLADDDAINNALYETYQNIITDVRKEAGEHREVLQIKKPRNVASSLAEARKLHFKDAPGELAYLKEYAQGTNVLETMSHHVETTARKTALMEVFGPIPENTISNTMEKMRVEIRDKKRFKDLSDDQRIKLLKELGDEHTIQAREGAIGKSLMFAMGEGTSFEAPRMKNVSQFIRSLNSVSKLGSAVLSQLPDMLNLTSEHRIVRGNNIATAWLETMRHYFFKMTPEKQAVLDRLGVMADAINYRNFNRFEADNLNNRLSRMNDTMFRITGQDLHVRKAKSGFALALSKDLGELSGKSFDEIPTGFKEALSQYGSINSQKWDLISKAIADEVDGAKYFHPDLINQIDLKEFESMIPEKFKIGNEPTKRVVKEGNFKNPVDYGDALRLADLDQEKALKKWNEQRDFHLNKSRFDLEGDLRTFFIEETRNAVLEPDLKVKRQITLGTKAGTYTGEAMRLLTQFKSFLFAYNDRVMGGKRFNKEAGKFDTIGVFHHVAASLALGYASMVAKDISKGIEPKDPTLVQTWMQAAFQSGGLGIMGDFIQGATARTGADFLATLAGPTATTIGKAANLGGKTAKQIYNASVGEDSDFSGLAMDSLDLVKANVPFQSLWFSRAAIELGVWSHLKESLEPGSIRRTERRLKKDFNQKYIISPSEIY